MKKHIISLIPLALITFVGISQTSLDSTITDSVTFSIEEARSLIKINEDRKSYAKLIGVKDSMLTLCNSRLDNREQAIGVYIAKESEYEDKVGLLQEKNSLIYDELELTKKKVKREKRKRLFIIIGAAVVEALTIVLLIK